MKISKRKLNLMVPLLCYILTIATAFFPNNMRYVMYGVVISVACIEELKKKKSDKLVREFPYFFLYIIIVEIITVIREIYEKNTISLGAIIQPIFLISCLIIGFNVGKKYGESGCKDLLLFFSVIFIFSACVCVPEYILKKSLFFPSYGNAWDAFRTPSIYGHPIRVGTSLTIALAIHIFLFRKSFIRWAIIILDLFGLFACESRSSWIACACTCLLFFVAATKKRVTRKKVIIAMSAIVIVLLFLMSNPGTRMIAAVVGRFAQATGDNVSKVQRLGTISYFASKIIDDFNPITFLLGHGEDAAANVMLETSIAFKNFSTTDNQYLLIFYNYGLIALIVVLGGIVKCIIRFIRTYESNGNTVNCLLFICISQAICSFFYELTENKTCAFLVLCSIGMLLSINVQSIGKKSGENVHEERKKRKY